MIHTLALQEMPGFYDLPPTSRYFPDKYIGPSDHSDVPLVLTHKWDSEALLIGEQVKKQSHLFLWGIS